MANFHLGSFSRNRIEAFSDGVFAIVVTLLVFELKLPSLHAAADSAAIFSAILGIVPKLISWVCSFLIVCVIWMNHHRLMDMFQGMDAGLFWLNNLLLMFTSLIPFPTAVLGDYPLSGVAVGFYGVCLALASACFTVLRLYILRHPDLLKPEVSLAAFRRGTRLSFWYGPVLYAAGAMSALVHPLLAFAVYVFIPVYFIFPKATKTT